MMTHDRESHPYEAGYPCWECPSSDAVTLYFNDEKPLLQCFSCGAKSTDNELVEEYMSKEKTNIIKKTQEDIDTQPTVIEHTGHITALEDRGISKSTAERFNVRTMYNGKGERTARVYPFYDREGDIIAQKIKAMDKSMYSKGNISKAKMFGQQLWTKGCAPKITITEGEEDAMAVYQMLSSGKFESAVVSIKTGAASASSCIDQHYEWLNSFSEIIICFDNDEQGQKAAMEVAKKFPNKARIVKMREKDANDYLKKGMQQKFKDDWFNAERLTIKGVYEFKDLWDELNREDSFTSVPYPWPDLQKKTYGMRTGELTIIKAPPKIGKTELLREVAWHIHETTDHHVGIVFLEEGLKRITQGFITKDVKKPVHLPDADISKTKMKESFLKIAEKGQFHIFDPKDEISVTNLFDKMMYFVHACGCKFIFIDHISMFAYKALTQDERRFLDSFLADLKEFANKYDVHICAVMHVNDDGKTRGSRAPVQLCNTMLDISRDKLNLDPVVSNTTKVVVEENRFNGDSGHAVNLLYDRDTGCMTVLEDSDIYNDIFDENKEEKDVSFKS